MKPDRGWGDFKTVGETRGDRKQPVTFATYFAVMLVWTLGGVAVAYLFIAATMGRIFVFGFSRRGPFGLWPAAVGGVIGFCSGLFVCWRIFREDRAERNGTDD